MIQIQTPIARRRRIPLMPLIDVIFILIMFFLLSSTFGIWRPLSVSLDRPDPGALTQQAETPNAPAVFIVVRAAGQGKRTGLAVNGVELAFGELAAELNRLVDRGAESALLVPGKGVDFQRVVHVLDEARASRLKRVSLHLD
jgi:biopolymer transport protein ExbD